MTLVERAQEIRARLMNPPNAVEDQGIDLRRRKSLNRNGVAEMKQVVDLICEHYCTDREKLFSEARTAAIVRPRQVAMYLAYTMTKFSLPQIGVMMGGRDHTTVLHGVRKMECLERTDPIIADEIGHLRRRLQRPNADWDWSGICFDRREI